MGVAYYVVMNKALMYAGKNLYEDLIDEAQELMFKYLHQIPDDDEGEKLYEALDQPISELTLRDARVILNAAHYMEILLDCDMRLDAFMALVENPQAKLKSESDLTEEEKEYPIINEWYDDDEDDKGVESLGEMVAKELNYPEEWDTVAYPTVWDALWEKYCWIKAEVKKE